MATQGVEIGTNVRQGEIFRIRRVVLLEEKKGAKRD